MPTARPGPAPARWTSPSRSERKGCLEMKKRIGSLVVAVLLSVATAVSAFATSEFKVSAFQDVDDYQIDIDDMTGEISISIKSLLNESEFVGTDDYLLAFYPMVTTNNDFDMFLFAVMYLGYQSENINQVIVKIGDNRYFFSDVELDMDGLPEWYTSMIDSYGVVMELPVFIIDNRTIPFMQDLIQHRDEEIKVRLVGANREMEFVLTQAMKDGIIGLYDRYVMAGGTRQENMDLITQGNTVNVEVRKVIFQ